VSRAVLRSRLFTASIGTISRVLIARDALLGLTRRLRRHPSQEKFYFASGERSLSAVFIPAPEGAPVILLCHGIGETVELWSAVQALLRDLGVGSMVFNYSGYGRSSGTLRAEHCDEDLGAAYAELRRRVGPETRVFVLGFSMGTGIAATGVRNLTPPPAGLILCEAYTSFREAICELGFPRWVALGFHDIWNTVANAPRAGVPVLVVHSDADKLFPVAMAQRIAQECGERGKLLVVNGLRHAEPYQTPTETYWGPIVTWLHSVPFA
jgi:alpha-beta hydrolase superfamily lysophospholipase